MAATMPPRFLRYEPPFDAARIACWRHDCRCLPRFYMFAPYYASADALVVLRAIYAAPLLR